MFPEDQNGRARTRRILHTEENLNRRRQKILLVNETFYPDKAATAQHLTDLAMELTEQGHDVTVLTARRGYTDPEALYPAREIRQGVTILRVGAFASRKRKVRFFRILNAVCLNLSFALHLLFMPRFDKVIALTSPPLVAWAAALYARWKKSVLVYWVMDLNPDEAVAAGWIRQGSLAEKLLSSALEYALHSSSLIIALDEYMSARIQHKGIGVGRIRVIPPWPLDTDLEYVPRQKNPFLREHHLEKKFVVMYSGNFSVCHPLNTLLNAALQLRHDPEIVFLFIGGGARLEEVLEFKAKHGLENVRHLPYVPRTQIKFSLSAANLHTVVMGEPFVGIVHPCKIYSVLRLGIPFAYIGPEKSHVGDLLAGGRPGFHVDHGEAGRLAGIIEELKTRGMPPHNPPGNLAAFSQKTLLGKITENIVSCPGDGENAE